MSKYPVSVAIVIVLILALWAGWNLGQQSAGGFAGFTEQIMAAPITVQVPTEDGAAEAKVVFDVFRQVDREMSEWKTTSPLSGVNRSAGSQAQPVPDALRQVIERGLDIGAMTGGAFDITWAAMWGLWDFKAASPRVPDDDAIAPRLGLIDYRQVVIDDNAGTVYLPQPGMALGLGGIAKGYALDQAAAALRARGINDFLISAGGQMMLGGHHGDRLWRVGIRDPRGEQEDYFAYLELTDTSIATSGDYERFFIIDGVRYHHILDPRTGKPARGVRSATVVCPDATLADALATSLMVMGIKRGMELAETTQGVEAVMIDDAGKVHVTSGLQGKLLFTQ